jgi:ribose transport system substrate-binding protein
MRQQTSSSRAAGRRIFSSASLAAWMVALGVVLAACGSDSSSDAPSGGTSQGGGAIVAEAKAAVERAQVPVAEFTGPKSGPKAVAGKKVMILSCAQASACSLVAGGAAEAARALGWDAQIVDGKGDPKTYDAAIENAVTAKVDGIIDIAVPPDLVASALRDTKAAGIPVINASEFLRETPGIFGNANPPWVKEGTIVADWLIADSGGEAKVVIFTDSEFPGVTSRLDAVAKRLEDCPGCEVLATTNLSINDITSPRMSQVTRAAVNRFGPELKYIVSPYDAADAFIVPALRAAGRTDVKIIGGAGGPQQMQFCRDGSVAAITVDSVEWMGWAAADQLNRAFAGEPPAAENNEVPTFLALKDTCDRVPEGKRGEDLIEVDYRGAYKRLWGVG